MLAPEILSFLIYIAWLQLQKCKCTYFIQMLHINWHTPLRHANTDAHAHIFIYSIRSSELNHFAFRNLSFKYHGLSLPRFASAVSQLWQKTAFMSNKKKRGASRVLVFYQMGHDQLLFLLIHFYFPAFYGTEAAVGFLFLLPRQQRVAEDA